jgi:hypothetical protein
MSCLVSTLLYKLNPLTVVTSLGVKLFHQHHDKYIRNILNALRKQSNLTYICVRGGKIYFKKIHTYHSLFIPKRIAESWQIFLRDGHVLPKCLSYEEAFYDIHGRRGEVLLFCSVSDTTQDHFLKYIVIIGHTIQSKVIDCLKWLMCWFHSFRLNPVKRVNFITLWFKTSRYLIT